MTEFVFDRLKWVLLLAFLFSIGSYQASAQEPYTLDPQEAEAGAVEVHLVLQGVGLGSFGELTDVVLSDYPLKFFYEIVDDQTFWVFVDFPMDVPAGEQRIIFFFQETSLAFPFFIFGPAQEIPELRLDNIFPGEGLIGTEVLVTLEGDGFSQLGSPLQILIGGIDVGFFDFVPESEQVMRFRFFIPEDVSAGDSEIVFIFEEAAFEEYFFVGEMIIEPGPPEQPRETTPGDEFPRWLLLVGAVIVGGGILLLGGGIALVRRLSGTREPVEKEESRQPEPQKLEFQRYKDSGVQQISPQDRPIAPDMDFRVDTSHVHIDTSVDQAGSIVKEDG